MTIDPRRAFVPSVAFIVSATLAHAHPGHDGHELTWDLSHLADHPLATVACFAFVSVASWVGWRLLRRDATLRVQSLRGSQLNRGK